MAYLRLGPPIASSTDAYAESAELLDELVGEPEHYARRWRSGGQLTEYRSNSVANRMRRIKASRACAARGRLCLGAPVSLTAVARRTFRDAGRRDRDLLEKMTPDEALAAIGG